jgi:hypothetical protein
MVVTANLVNSIGLVFDIVGACLIFKFGLPKWIPRDNEDVVFDGGEVGDSEPPSKIDWYTKWNKMGLIFLIVGFVLQFVSDFIPGSR